MPSQLIEESAISPYETMENTVTISSVAYARLRGLGLNQNDWPLEVAPVMPQISDSSQSQQPIHTTARHHKTIKTRGKTFASKDTVLFIIAVLAVVGFIVPIRLYVLWPVLLTPVFVGLAKVRKSRSWKSLTSSKRMIAPGAVYINGQSYIQRTPYVSKNISSHIIKLITRIVLTFMVVSTVLFYTFLLFITGAVGGHGS
jgi:hypothetical protein